MSLHPSNCLSLCYSNTRFFTITRARLKSPLVFSALRNKVLRPLVRAATQDGLGEEQPVKIPMSLPTPIEAWKFVKFAGPIFFTNLGKFAPYTFATLAVSQSAGALSLAGHQVMLGVYFTFVMFSEPMGMTAQAFLPDAMAATRKQLDAQERATNAGGGVSGSGDEHAMQDTTANSGAQESLPVVRLLRRIFAISATISAAVAGAACAGPAFFPGTFTTDPLVVREMHKLVPLMFLLILPHPLTMCFEGVLLACRDIRYLTVIYAANTLAVAAIMRVVAKTSASTSAVWAGLIAWNTARFLEEGTRILARARRLVGVPITEVLFGKKGVPARRSSGQAGL